jgi:hypothetical protein
MGPTISTRADGCAAWQTEEGWVICAQVGVHELRAKGATLSAAEGALHAQGRALGATLGLGSLSSSLLLATLLERLRAAA